MSYKKNAFIVKCMQNQSIPINHHGTKAYHLDGGKYLYNHCFRAIVAFFVAWIVLDVFDLYRVFSLKFEPVHRELYQSVGFKCGVQCSVQYKIARIECPIQKYKFQASHWIISTEKHTFHSRWIDQLYEFLCLNRLIPIMKTRLKRNFCDACVRSQRDTHYWPYWRRFEWLTKVWTEQVFAIPQK